jgi:hypothetical protein
MNEWVVMPYICGHPEVGVEGGVEGEGEPPQGQQAPGQPGHQLTPLHSSTQSIQNFNTVP